MKKITLLCVMLLFSIAGMSQVLISENFDAGTPAGWTDTYGNTTTLPCSVASERDNLYSFSTSGNLTSPNQVGASNNTDLTINFDYKIVDYDFANPIDATPVGWGSADLQYSTDDGANWNTVLTIDDANHVVSATCAAITPVVIPAASLPMSSDVKLRIFNTWVAGDYYFYIDNFTATQVVSSAPNCAANLMSTPDVACGNFDTTISWDATASVIGYYLTVGTTSGGTDVLNNVDVGNIVSYDLGGQLSNTTYYWTVVPFNGAGLATGCGENTYTTFVTGCYCTSNPTSNDGNGISNVQLDTTDFATGDVTYMDHTATAVDLGQGITANTQITFETGYSYDTNIWIDFNDDFTFDVSELVFSGESLAANPTVFDASFTMPGAAPLGNHRMRIATADTGQVPAEPCYNGSYGVTLDFTVNIVTVSCSPATATSALVPDCANNQFFVDVDVTIVGDATDITDTVSTWPISGTGIVTVGPFTDGSSVNLTITHTDSACDLALGNFTYICPIANDDCADAEAIVIPVGICPGNIVTTTMTATEGADELNSCDGFANFGLWYSFTGPVSGEMEFTSGAGNPGIVIYEGVCGALTEVAGTCFNNVSGTITGLTSGNPYYAMVSTDTQEPIVEFCLNTLACTPNVSAFAIVNDCAVSGGFYVSVDVTNLGTSTAVSISDDQGSTDISSVGIGIYNMGPYVNATDVVITVVNDDDAACSVVSSSLTQSACPPVNNDCATPTVLTPGLTFTSNPLVGTNIGATDSGELATTCSLYGGGDVWYSVVVPADGNITIETNSNSSSMTDTGMEVYSGTCGSLVSVECDDDDSADGAFSLVDLTGRTPGEVLLIRVWEYGGGTEDTFQVSAYNATLSIDDLILSEGFSAYPNPVIDELTVSAKSEIKTLSIVNMLGQTVRTVTPNSRNYKLNLADLSSGIYFVKATVNNTEGTFRIMKK